MALGDIVIYTAADGVERAAIVSRAISADVVNLQVIPDGEDDGDSDPAGRVSHEAELAEFKAARARGEIAEDAKEPRRDVVPVVAGFVSAQQLVAMKNVARDARGTPGTWRPR